MPWYSELWYKWGYKWSLIRYRKLWGEPPAIQYRRGIQPKKVLVCLPPPNGPVPDSIRVLSWLPNYFPTAEFRIVHFEDVSGSIPIAYRNWGALGKSHFNAFGMPKRTFLDGIRGFEAELVIDLSDPCNEVTDLICATAGCKWHAALTPAGNTRFTPSANIIITPREGASRQERYKALLHYLKPKE